MFDRVDPDAAPPAPRAPRSALAWFGAAVMAALTLVACGGGGDGGVGSNGTGITMGTVNGFGSVIVDGVRFDDSRATVRIEAGADGNSYVPAEVKLGHRTRVEYSGDPSDTVTGRATLIELDPSVVGQVEDKTINAFVVLGQRIEINETAGVLPVTVYEGYSNFAAIANGEVVEVHAIRLTDGATVTYLATRIEKKSVAPPFVRVAGVVSNLPSGSASTYQIGPLTVTRNAGTNIMPSGVILQNGTPVVVYASTYTLGSLALTADKIRIRQTSIDAASTSYVSGVVRNYSAGTSLEVDGVTVRLDISPPPQYSPDVTAIADGAYVRVKGAYGSNGVLQASTVQVRDGSRDAELRGTMFDYVAPLDDSTPGSFTVRDTRVQLTLTQVPSSCAGGTFGNGAFVEVKGEVSANGITATRVIECEDAASLPSGAVIEVHGTVLSLPSGATSGTFSLSTPNEQTVSYSSTTFFRNVTLADLVIGFQIEVEGVMSGGVLNATKIKLDD